MEHHRTPQEGEGGAPGTQFYLSPRLNDTERRAVANAIAQLGGQQAPEPGDPRHYHVLPLFTVPSVQAELERWGGQVPVIGPPCLHEAAQGRCPLPDVVELLRSPRYSNCMRGIVFSSVGLSPAKRNYMRKLTLYLGGKWIDGASEEVTHLIVQKVNNSRYKDAIQIGYPSLVHPDWVLQCWKQQELLPLDWFPVPPFLGLKISMSGLEPDQQRSMASLCRQNGGQIHQTPSAQCTHMIVGKPEANAQRWAAQNGVLAVNLNWFFDSIEKEVCMNEEDYHPEVPQGPVLRQVRETEEDRPSKRRCRSKSFNSFVGQGWSKPIRGDFSSGKAVSSPSLNSFSRVTHRRASYGTTKSFPHPLPGMRTVKLQLAPRDLRRFRIRLPRLWAKFLKFLHTQYPDVFAAQGDRVRVVFRYLDESGDQCILSSQAEWDALLLNPVIGPIIRLSIEFCEVRPDQSVELGLIENKIREGDEPFVVEAFAGEKPLDSTEAADFDKAEAADGGRADGDSNQYASGVDLIRAPAVVVEGPASDRENEEEDRNSGKDGSEDHNLLGHWTSKIMHIFHAPVSPLMVDAVNFEDSSDPPSPNGKRTSRKRKGQDE